MPPSTAEPGSARFPEIDLLKAAGALAIVLIHCIASELDPQVHVTWVDRWLNELLRFAVPAFLFASGFLDADPARPVRGRVLRRLRRLLLPYLVASLCAEAWHVAQGTPRPWAEIGSDLVFGAAFGPYYYVFVMVTLLPVAALLPAMSRATALRVGGAVLLLHFLNSCVSGISAQLGRQGSMFWYLRNPLVWWPYYLVGWCTRSALRQVRDVVEPRRATIAAGASVVGAVGLCISVAAPPAIRIPALFVHTYAFIAVLFVLGMDRRLPAVVIALSTASYTVYLYHLFFVEAVQGALPATLRTSVVAALLVKWPAGLAGSLVLVAIARRLIPRQAKDVVGA